ncbi:hypothetical protein GT360_01475 [Vibrio astriarenae]|uniref:Uncharacterized protein n=1 Tax=Vibrio astriarenae TaxID=1481923 RepID=A0A7Z2T0Y7_9VIBR|nr:hypothetical protein [Vibrio astriarenae]QIA62280.1 hypothetical protein GT360_01475 [Vibrio astriarenae]
MSVDYSKRSVNMFDEALPPLPSKLKAIPTRLIINNRAIHLANPNRHARLVFQAIHNAVLSDWWQQTLNSVTQRTYVTQISCFTNWLNDQKLNDARIFHLLEDYQTYRINQNELLPQSTGTKDIKILLEEGAASDTFTPEEQRFIRLLVESTGILKGEEPTPFTLSGWFTNIDWLRPLVGDSNWLALESPKRLMGSFSVTVACSLLWILQIKSAIFKLMQKYPHITEIGKGLTSRQRNFKHCRELLVTLIQHSNELPEGAVELLLADCLNPNVLKTYNERIRDGKTIGLKIKVGSCYQNTFIQPHIFHPDYITSHSRIEQLLMAWLCAWQTVQPTDVRKLKSNNFYIHYNKYHRPISVQCAYYKGRSSIQEPQILDSSLIEAKAIIAYLETLPDDEVAICPIGGSVSFTPTSNYSIPGLLTRIWETPTLSKLINTRLKARSSSDLFRHLYLCMIRNSQESYAAWYLKELEKQQQTSYELYREKVSRPLPISLFGLAAIKTSSIQARSDKYRDSDLINTNSHSAGVEKTNYMTDKNKEWVNLNGRITRIVLDDIENHVFKLNIDAALSQARERNLQTKIQKISSNQNVQINPLGQVITPSAAGVIKNGEPDMYVVWDTPETVVYFLHYLSEAERQANRLIQNALQFFERTVLPDAEWMSLLLNNRISPEVVKEGTEKYKQLHKVLPPLFEAQIYGGVGT